MSPAAPAFPFLSAPYPPSPLPRRGRRRDYSFLMQGASPLASPGAEPGRHLQPQQKKVPGGGACLLCRLPALPFRKPQRAWRFWSPACPACSLLCCPQPPSPLPLRGRGSDYSFLMQGTSPLASPGAEPMVRRKNDRKRLPMGSAGSQGEGGPGERNFGV